MNKLLIDSINSMLGIVNKDDFQGEHWLPMRRQMYSSALSTEFVTSYELPVAVGYEKINLDGVVDWSDREGFNNSWHLYFHSLCWLFSVEHAYDSKKFPGFVWWLKGVVFDYIEKCILNPNEKKMLWDDHSSSYRLSVLGYFYKKYLCSFLTDEESAVFLSALRVNSNVVSEFLHSDKWLKNNHAVFHSLSIISYTTNFPSKASVCLQKTALNHLETVLANIVDVKNGISLEQSPHYHVWTIKLLMEVSDYLYNCPVQLSFDIDSVLLKMLDFSDLLLSGRKSLPAIGDTPLFNSYSKSNIDDLRKSVCQRLNKDVNYKSHYLFDSDFNFWGFEESGYYITNSVDSGNKLSSLYLSKENIFSHGHFDSMSFTCAYNGMEVLIDSGGPYAYGDKFRFEYFMSSYAHNVVVVDGKQYKGGANILSASVNSDLGYSIVSSTIDDLNGASHRRFFIHSENGFIVVLDILNQYDGDEHDYDLLYHISPDIEVSLNADIAKLYLKSTVSECKVSSNMPLSSKLISGRESEYPLGWVTKQQTEFESSNVLCFSISGVKSCELLSLFDFSGTIKKLSFNSKKNIISIQEKNGSKLVIPIPI